MSYTINIDEQDFELNPDDLNQLDLIETEPGKFHFLQDNTSYQVQLLSINFSKKEITLSINGNEYDLSIEDEYDQLVKKMGLSLANSQKMTDIKAPMPGLVLDVLVEVGQTLEKGDQLLILEAMKMENVLKAEGEGIVKSIEIAKGDAVDKGQILIEME